MHRSSLVFIRRAFDSPQKTRWLSALAEKREKSAEYSDEPEYPPLFDASCLGRQLHKRRLWYDQIRSMPTVDEKMIAICKGFLNKDGPDIRIRVCKLPGLYELYNTLPLQLNCTRTHLIRGQLPTLSSVTGQLSENQVDAIVQRVKPIVLDTIRDVYGGNVPLDRNVDDGSRRDRLKRDRWNGQQMIDQLYRAISLVGNLEHLHECQVDYNPRCDAFWVKGDFQPDVITRDIRKNILKKYPNRQKPDDPVDIWFQYVGDPYMQLRSQLPFPEFVGRDDPVCTQIEIPEFSHDPRAIGYKYDVKIATSVPGFWPTDPCSFGLLSFHTRQRGLVIEEMYGKEALADSISGLGVIASFGWLASLATHNGFNTFNEITYPMTTQTVVTNGHLWSFFLYQLNTLTLGMDFEKKHQNICWATEELKLFEIVEGEDVKGFNDDVLKTLVTFITRQPREVDFNLRPYLRNPECTEEESAKIRAEFKNKYSNRALPNNHPETPLWETIYKKKFQTKID